MKGFLFNVSSRSHFKIWPPQQHIVTPLTVLIVCSGGHLDLVTDPIPYKHPLQQAGAAACRVRYRLVMSYRGVYGSVSAAVCFHSAMPKMRFCHRGFSQHLGLAGSWGLEEVDVSPSQHRAQGLWHINGWRGLVSLASLQSVTGSGCVKWSERKGAQRLVIFGVYQKAESLHREPESSCAVCLSLPHIILPQTPSESKKTDTWKDLEALNVIFWG